MVLNGMTNDIESGPTEKHQPHGTFRKDLMAEESRHSNRKWIMVGLVLILGVLISCAFLFLGVHHENEDHQTNFERSATEKASWIYRAGRDYETIALLAHDSCNRLEPVVGREPTLLEALHLCSRAEFRNLYEHILSFGVGLYSLQYVTKVDHAHREALEEDSRAFLAENHPEWLDHYKGISQLPDLSRHVDIPFYYPLHNVEPFEGNEAVLDMNVYNDFGHGKQILDYVFSSWQSVMSPRTKLAQDADPDVYSVYLTHPGTNTTVNGNAPYAVSAVVIRIPDLLLWAASGAKRFVHNNEQLFLFDATDDPENPAFLGGMEIRSCAPGEELCTDSGLHLEPIRETAYHDMPASGISYETELEMVDRRWLVSVVSVDSRPDLLIVILGSCIIFGLFLLLAVVFWYYLKHMSKAEGEKARAARNQVRRERYLNEYLAHEVRNPLSCAMAALNLAITNTREQKRTSKGDEESQSLLLNDLGTVDHSLAHINDLLRSMLDMNRAAFGQIKVDEAPTDILRDILEPAAAILSTRGSKNVKILTECEPADLVVVTDSLRLKQIVLNLSINATKFVERGFVRLRATTAEEDGCVRICIEDSGPGVPEDKRDHLFEAFQESLDLLNQGTGLGLFICSSLSKTLGARLWFDDSYVSEIPGAPGSRFAIDLGKKPVLNVASICESMIVKEEITEKTVDATNSDGMGSDDNNEEEKQLEELLPQSLKVLFVDDEMILRKLFIRTVSRFVPSWDIEEAGNSNTALHLVEQMGPDYFDVIFMDQYMPCVERPLLGTEVVRLMRTQGVSSTICGLSANDLREEFQNAGADGFIMKPFPCAKDRLTSELAKLFKNRSEQQH